jgi:hypothetical protein
LPHQGPATRIDLVSFKSQAFWRFQLHTGV